MNSLQDKSAMAAGASIGPPVVVVRRSKRKTIGILLCAAAVVVVAAWGAMAFSSGVTSTDNAYVRGDVTSLAAKVAGYVTAVEVGDNQTVRAGDVLFRIDDRDYRARLAQAVANVSAAQARLSHVDAQIELQRALIRQAQAQRRSASADMNPRAQSKIDRQQRGEPGPGRRNRHRAISGRGLGIGRSGNGRGATATHRRVCR